MARFHESSRRSCASPGRPPARATLLAGLSAAILASGCDGCRGSKPYTPYKLSDAPPLAVTGSAAPLASAAPADGGAVDAGPSFVVVQGTAAPDDGKTWPLEGDGSLPAPAGRAFGEGLVFDVDGDGKRDLLVWARAPDGLRGEVWLFPRGKAEEGRTVAALPADLAAPGCSAATHLALVGPRTVMIDFEPRCGAKGRDRAVRWIGALRVPPAGSDPSIAPEIGLEIRLGAPADGESFHVALDPRDRDGDGRSDLTFTVTLAGAPKPFPAGGSAPVALAYFDRHGGLSRDPSEPEASIKALAAGLVADARRKTGAPRIPAAALAFRRLHALLCEESGRPIVTTSSGHVRCGEARLVEDVAVAEVEAALNLDDPVAAVAALARLDAIAPRRKDVDKLIARWIPEASAAQIHRSRAVPAIGRSPAFGPLAFNAGGDVLVHTASGIVRVDRTSFAEAPVDAAIRWPVELASSADSPAWTLSSIEERCDAPTLIARFGDATAPLPILTPLKCTPSAAVPADLLGRAGDAALLAVRGEVIAIPTQAPPRAALAEALASPGATVELGAARSPDGATFALPTPRGVLVVTPKGAARAASARFWTKPTADGASFCVPSNAAARLACAAADAAVVYEAK